MLRNSVAFAGAVPRGAHTVAPLRVAPQETTLRRGTKVKANIRLTARGGAGNLTTGKRTVKLKR